MRERKSLAAALILVLAVLFAVPVLAEEPAAPEAPGLIDFEALTAKATQDAPAESEEPAMLPEDPSKPIFVWEDSGICCTSSASCPTISGYAKKCDSASCGRSCLYRRL
jgi:hypothetical protein